MGIHEIKYPTLNQDGISAKENQKTTLLDIGDVNHCVFQFSVMKN